MKTIVYTTIVFGAFWQASCGAAKPSGKIEAVADGQGATDAIAQEVAGQSDAAKALEVAPAQADGLAVARKPFDHTSYLTNCAYCHASVRPVLTGDIKHGEGQSCEKCHTYDITRRWKSTVVGFSHTPTPASCLACHSTKRPAPPHDAAGDCVTCHSNPDWAVLKAGAFNHSPEPASCVGCHESKRPVAPHDVAGDCVSCHSNPDWKVLKAGAFSHTPEPASCVRCHAAKRPAPPHDAAGDCVTCHSNPDWKVLKPGAFSHDPEPVSCVRCHAIDRPAPPHNAAGDCVTCHSNPNWKVLKPGAFSHDPEPASCVGCHANKRPAPPHDATGDCVTCHSNPDWKVLKPGAFSHIPKPATCEGCHARPTVVGARAYPNQGPPTGFNPNNAAEAGSGHYVGKDCVSCHGTPPEGSAGWNFTHAKPNPGVCLPCHFNKGNGEHRGESNITLTGFGNCTNCHINYDRTVRRDWGRK